MKALYFRFAVWALRKIVRLAIWLQQVAIEDGHTDLFPEAVNLEISVRKTLRKLEGKPE